MLNHPSIQRLARVARALGALRAQIVFIGGAIAPLLHTERTIRDPRATTDVDGVCMTSSYSEHGALQDELRKLGFREAIGIGALAHRWRSLQDDIFDLVPVGNVLGATGQGWDVRALESANAIQLDESLSIRIPSAPAFLALKWAAFVDRGSADPLASDDLEDILALIASRASIVSEVATAHPGVRAFVVLKFTTLSTNPSLEDLLAGYLNGAMDPSSAMDIARKRLHAIAALGSSA